MQRADPIVPVALQTLLGHPESQEALLELIKRPVRKAGVRSMRREAEKLDALAKLGIPDDVLSGSASANLSS